MYGHRYRVLYSTEVANQMGAAHEAYPREIEWLTGLVTELCWAVLTVEELEERGRLKWSEKDQTYYLYQHVNPGRVCLSLAIDEEELKITIISVIEISYTKYAPLERSRTNQSGTRNS